MDRWKGTARKKLRHGASQKWEDQRWRRSEREKVRREKMQVREKVGKSRNTVFFQWFVAPESKSGGCGASWPDERLEIARRCGAKHICKSKCAKNQGRTTFGSWDVEKVHVVVARSTFPSKKHQKLTGLDHFWKLRCRKSVRRCSAKHVSKLKCTKHTILGPVLEVAMSKKCTPLWHEAHFQVKIVKDWGARSSFWRLDDASMS